MYNLTYKDTCYLLNISDAVKKIEAYTAIFKTADEFFTDVKTFDAVLMNFIVIGEMVEKLPETLKDQTENKVDWFKIKGFRNILAHNYFGVDAEEVWQIIHDNIPALKAAIQGILAD
ncbi:DUF86 domain-containing protein [Bacteroidia bacterium]|nr:DUF86 domain-containing protein [Bacteroidia bacterium]